MVFLNNERDNQALGNPQMESRNLIFRGGHFYDVETKQRVALREGAEVCLVSDSVTFLPTVPAGEWPLAVKSEQQKKETIQSDTEIADFRRIYSAGQVLYFNINRLAGGKRQFHEFAIELLEDLYLYRKSKWQKQDERLYDCACVVKNNISGSLEFFEPVYANSLNELYKNTYVHYFGNNGSPTCNAIDRFYEQAGHEELNIGRLRNVKPPTGL